MRFGRLPHRVRASASRTFFKSASKTNTRGDTGDKNELQPIKRYKYVKVGGEAKQKLGALRKHRPIPPPHNHLPDSERKRGKPDAETFGSDVYERSHCEKKRLSFPRDFSGRPAVSGPIHPVYRLTGKTTFDIISKESCCCTLAIKTRFRL